LYFKAKRKSAVILAGVQGFAACHARAWRKPVHAIAAFIFLILFNAILSFKISCIVLRASPQKQAILQIGSRYVKKQNFPLPESAARPRDDDGHRSRRRHPDDLNGSSGPD